MRCSKSRLQASDTFPFTGSDLPLVNEIAKRTAFMLCTSSFISMGLPGVPDLFKTNHPRRLGLADDHLMALYLLLVIFTLHYRHCSNVEYCSQDWLA